MKEDLPTIAILGTGGTIAGKAGSASATTGYVPGSATVEDLLASVPGLEDIANLTSVQVSNIGSEDMTDEIWACLVKETESQLKDPEVAGVVITHGTACCSRWFHETGNLDFCRRPYESSERGESGDYSGG